MTRRALPATRAAESEARDAAARALASEHADLVERELPTYADREAVEVTAACLRELLRRARA